MKEYVWLDLWTGEIVLGMDEPTERLFFTVEEDLRMEFLGEL